MVGGIDQKKELPAFCLYKAAWKVIVHYCLARRFPPAEGLRCRMKILAVVFTNPSVWSSKKVRLACNEEPWKDGSATSWTNEPALRQHKSLKCFLEETSKVESGKVVGEG